MNLKLEQLRVFVTVAKARSLTEAADYLGRTASAVSMTLAQIENQLNGKLFEGERKVKLTPLGEFTLQQATLAVECHQRAICDIQRFAQGNEGLVRLAVVPSVATQLLPPIIYGLRKTLPNLKVDIRDIDSQAIQEAIHKGQVDFGIASLPDDDSLDSEFILEDSYQLICHRDHPLTNLKHPVQLDDIEPNEFIVNGLCEQITVPGMQTLIQKANLYIHNTSSILAFVKDGLGVTILPALTRPHDNVYAALPINNLDEKRALYILKRKSVSLSPIDTRLIEAIRGTIDR